LGTAPGLDVGAVGLVLPAMALFGLLCLVGIPLIMATGRGEARS